MNIVAKKSKKTLVKTNTKKEKVEKINPEVLNQMKEESKRIRDILRANNLQPQVNGFGDYKMQRVKSSSPTLHLDFKNPKIAEDIANVLSKKYGYNSTIKDKLVSVVLIKYKTKHTQGQLVFLEDSKSNTTKTTAIKNKVAAPKNVATPKSTPKQTHTPIPADKGDDLPLFKEMRDRKILQEEEKIELLRSRAKRIVGLIRHKFDISNVRGDKKNGYNSSRIHNPNIAGYWMRFPSDAMAQKVASFLESENYIVSLTHREITVDLLSTPEDVKVQKHEQTSELKKQNDLAAQLNEALEKARTAHLTPTQIGERIWQYMEANKIIILDATRKISLDDLCNGVQLKDWDKESFTNLVVIEALK